MKALIILAHGSRRKESNLEVQKLSNQVKKLTRKEFEIVDCAFLEVTKPSLIDLVEKIISKNVSEITVFPYFLNSGVHITTDIPNIIENARAKHPSCKFILCPPIGAYKNMPELVIKQLKSM